MTDLADRFTTEGFCYPLDVLTPDAALALGEELLRIQAADRPAALGNKGQFQYPHVISRAAAEVVRHPVLLDAAESILGPDILVWGSTLFAKAPHSRSYVSWHQDLHYWGLDGDAEVAAWIALGPVSEASGCMHFVPGSHLGDRRNTPDGRHVVTPATARPVVRRSQSFLGVLHLEEIFEPDPEQLKL